MPSVSVRINTEPVQRLLDRLRALLRDPRPVLDSIAQQLLQLSRQSFQTERSPEGAAWAPLNPRYLERKSRIFGRQGKLIATGSLFRSLQAGVLPGNSGVFVGAGPLPYAAIHQFGGRAGRGRRAFIPARPYLPSAATAERLAQQALEDALAKAVRG